MMPRTSLALAALSAALAAAPLARAGDPSAEAAKSYRIDTAGSTERVAPGGKGTIVLSIVPIAKVHVHPQAPLKITLESTPGLKLEKTSLGKADPVDPAAEGKQEARAKLDFFICSDQWCVKQVRDVTVPVDVR